MSSENLELDPAFAKTYGITEGMKVDIGLELDPPLATTVEVEPLTPSDWETIELHAGALENNLIYQTRAVRLDSNFVVYISDSITATLKVLKITPAPSGLNKFAKLSSSAEVHVAPKTRRPIQKKRSQSVRSVSSSRRNHENAPFTLMRGISLPHNLFQEVQEVYRYEIFANFNEVQSVLENAEFVNVSVIPGPQDQTADQQPQQPNQDIVKKFAAKLVHDDKISGAVGLSRILAISLGVENTLGHIVKLEKLFRPNYNKNPTLIFHPLTTESKAKKKDEDFSINNENSKREKEAKREKAKEMKEILLKSFYSLGLNQSVLSNNLTLPVMDGLPEGGLLEFKESTIPWLLPIGDSKISLEIGSEVLVPRSKLPSSLADKPDTSLDQQFPVGQTELLKKIERKLRKGNVGALIHGASGSGKSLVVDQISQKFHDQSVYVLKIDCNDYSKESGQNLKAKIEFWLKKCSWYGPALLILEGLENIFPAETEQGDSTQSRQITEYFIQAVNQISKPRNLMILSTTRSKESVNSLLFSNHCIEEFFNVTAPNKEVRGQILEEYLKKFNLSLAQDFDLSEMAVETEGYLPGDLKVLVDRINHETVYQSLESEDETKTSISNDLFSTAIKGFTPSNLRGVKLQKSTTNWADIGGLTDAKSILLETLEWPTKYAPIFKSATLRLRSGILLYGYPGCGKTLLASAVAGQCGLNFISVKGPEILNKYIGASEQSVRELFERAQAAKPCILFFDEFDSIAPKRGHDSTGVTDRVVNQMLTQMDGAEGLDGVYVLAATSRPDLIDSALLRPGRLDKSVICDLPNYEDRLDILKSITRKMLLSEDVVLEDIAKETRGFSGADLQALGYNSYLKAVHEKLESDKLESEGELKSKSQSNNVHEFFQVSLKQLKEQANTDLKAHERTQILRQIESLYENSQIQSSKKSSHQSKKADVRIFIRHDDFLSSLADTKPSISVSEKYKLSAIYNKFETGRDGNLPDGTSSDEVGARSTLM